MQATLDHAGDAIATAYHGGIELTGNRAAARPHGLNLAQLMALAQGTALVHLAEAGLSAHLAAATPVPAPAVTIAALPAKVLAQRPVVFSAEREPAEE